jgi:hypothetical protein
MLNITVTEDHSVGIGVLGLDCARLWIVDGYMTRSKAVKMKLCSGVKWQRGKFGK